MTTMRKILDEKGYSFFFVSPYDSLQVALRRLAEHKVGALLVMEGERLYGIFSERDFVRLVAKGGNLSLDTAVGDVMTAQVFGVHLDTSVDQAMGLMTDKRVRHLPVMKERMVVGLVSIGDVVKYLIADKESQIRGMEVLLANHELPT